MGNSKVYDTKHIFRFCQWRNWNVSTWSLELRKVWLLVLMWYYARGKLSDAPVCPNSLGKTSTKRESKHNNVKIWYPVFLDYMLHFPPIAKLWVKILVAVMLQFYICEFGSLFSLYSLYSAHPSFDLECCIDMTFLFQSLDLFMIFSIHPGSQ